MAIEVWPSWNGDVAFVGIKGHTECWKIRRSVKTSLHHLLSKRFHIETLLQIIFSFCYYGSFCECHFLQ